MKNYIKGFGIIVALLYNMNALAGGTVKVNGVTVGTAATGLNDGNEASASIDVGSGKCTLTMIPGSGKYITVNEISAIKTIDGSNAQTRTPGFNAPVTITASDETADPSRTTSYTFEVLDENYDYEITANFQNRTSVDNATVTVADGTYTYSGSPIKPEVTVTIGDKNILLTKDTDYKVYYKDNINAGIGKVIIEGIRKYNGSKGYWGGDTTADNPAATYTINKAAIEPQIDMKGWTYGSTPYQPSVKDGGNPGNGGVSWLYKTDGDQDFHEITLSSTTPAGEYTVQATVAETDNYQEGTATAVFTVAAKSIEGVEIILTPESSEYNGENQKPEVIVKDGENQLEEDVDYTLTNDGRTNVGKYTVTITGKGNYDSNTTTSKDFNITALDKAPTVALTNPDEAIVYDGNAKEPTLTVSVVIKDGDAPTVLTLDTDYTVVYSDNVNAGTNTAKATVTLKGNYKGTGSTTFTIAPKSIANVNISDIADQAYTGNAIEPTVSVKDGDKDLVLNTDYTISYSNNTAAAASDAENAPTVIITGKGNYDAQTTATKKFTITKATVTLAYSSDKAEAKMGEEFTAPTLDNPSKVAVTYSSSKTDVATISEEGVVTLIGAGQTTITASFAGNDNYESASASYELTVAEQQNKQQNAGLSWTDEGMEYYLGDYWWGPRLNNPNNLKVKYESSDEKVATIDKDGNVTALAKGDTWIMAIFEGNDEYEAQTVRYALMVKERYDLLVNDKRVTSDNCRDILDDGHFFYDEGTNQLVVTSNDNPVTIESHLKNLTIFLNGSSKLERIFFNNEGNEQNTGSLTITTYDNIPGKVILETTNANGVISGFSSLTIDKKSCTYLLDPVDGKYEGGKLVTAEGAVAMNATIGQYLKPLVNGQTVTFPPGEFASDDFTNMVIDDILFTLLQRTGDSDEDDDYYDPVESAIVLNNLNSTSGVTMLIDNVEKDGLIPGSNEYALQFKGGITFMVPNGEGTITLNLKTEPGYKLMLMIGKSEPKEISQNERGDVQFTYDVKEATYCCIYLVQSASTRGTRIGKRDRHHGTIYSIKVEPTKVRNMNPLGEVEGYPGNQKPEVVVHSSTGIKEIKVEPTNETSGDDSWYDMQGRKIDKPTKAGIYIQNRKKIVIR